MHKQSSPSFFVTFSRLREKAKAYTKIVKQWILYPELFLFKSSSELSLHIPSASSPRILPRRPCLNPAHEANVQSNHEQGGTHHPVGYASNKRKSSCCFFATQCQRKATLKKTALSSSEMAKIPICSPVNCSIPFSLICTR